MSAVLSGVGEGGVTGLSFGVQQVLDKECSTFFLKVLIFSRQFGQQAFFPEVKIQLWRRYVKGLIRAISTSLWKLSTCQGRGSRECCERSALRWPGGGSAVPQAGLKGREFSPQGGSRSQDFKNWVPGAVFVIRVRKMSTVMNDPNRRAFFSPKEWWEKL